MNTTDSKKRDGLNAADMSLYHLQQANPAIEALPETVLQFGTGRLLRALCNWSIHESNLAGTPIGRIVAVQSTEGERSKLLNSQKRSCIAVRGLQGGRQVDELQEVGCISRALVASSQWHEVLEVARSPKLRFIISNTTEKGYELDPRDGRDALLGAHPPYSFPAKLLAVLYTRFEEGLGGLTILPTELLENNGLLLRDTVRSLAAKLGVNQEFISWLDESCRFRSTLVDRIVPGAPKDHPLCGVDPLITMAEPFAFWAIEYHPGDEKIAQHSAITYAPDVAPYFFRKVRILNGAHTALVSHWIANGRAPYTLVREAMADEETRRWLERLVFEEIVPVVDSRVEDARGFAEAVFERFANPFIDHKLADIELYHATKVQVRLQPTHAEYLEQFKQPPPLLSEVLKTAAV